MFPTIPHANMEAIIAKAETIETTGGIYLLCFPDINPETKSNLGHCAHYFGSTDNFRERYLRHLSGKGANVLRVSNLRNGEAIPEMYTLEIANPIHARLYERYFKQCLKNPRLYCPIHGSRRLPNLPPVGKR